MDEKLLQLVIRETIKTCSIAEFGSPNHDWSINVDELAHRFRLRYDQARYPLTDTQGNPMTEP